MRSEDNLTSPLPEDSRQDVRGGESPFREGSRQDVRNGDRPDIVRAPEPLGGKDVAVCLGTVSIDGTGRCAPRQDVHDSFGHRSSHHSDIPQHVDGSVTVQRENSCLSTVCSSTGKGSLAPTLPSRRVHGTTCAKVWNAVRREKRDCIFLKGKEPKSLRAKSSTGTLLPILGAPVRHRNRNYRFEFGVELGERYQANLFKTFRQYFANSPTGG